MKSLNKKSSSNRFRHPCIVMPSYAGYLIIFFFFCYHSNAQYLKVGDLAPKLNVLEWLKGGPINEFKKGQVYVVEFTGSQCGPCRAIAPHMTELAHRYSGKITMIGVCVFENGQTSSKKDTSYLKRTREFVRAMGNRMGYNVSVDGPAGTMYETWMKPADQNGIPCAFMVDKYGKIAWIGYPKYIDPILYEIVNEGKLNKNTIDSIEEQEHTYISLIQNKDYQGAIKMLDQRIAEAPSNSYSYFEKFDLLLKYDVESAFVYGNQILKGACKNDEIVLNYLTNSILEEKNLNQTKWIILANSFAKRGIQISKDSMMVSRLYNMLARICAEKQQDFRNAELFQKLAISYLKNYDKSDKMVAINEEWLRFELKKYQDKLTSKYN